MYQRKRLDLLTNLHTSISPLHLGQLKNAHKAAIAKFVVDIAAALKGPSYDFAQVVTRCTAEARDGFLAIAKGGSLGARNTILTPQR